MSAFIKAIEIWVPCKDQLQLEFCTGLYGDLKEFEDISINKTFGYNNGLPGKTWAAGHPLVLNDFEGSYFERIEAAKLVGITAGIALPIFSCDFLMAVIVFLCGDEEDEDNVGAIEVWHCDTTKSHDLELVDGYFGTLEHFKFKSLHSTFRKGTGLPGIVWERNMPVIMNNLGQSHRFIRSEGAIEAGITTGLGIPAFHDKEHIYILAFLSARGTPICRQIEVWVPDKKRENLKFETGYSEKGIDISSAYQETDIPIGENTISRVFITGVPSICKDLTELSNLNLDSNLTSMVAIPIIEDGRCKCIVAMYS